MTDAEAIARLQIARATGESWPLWSRSGAEQRAVPPDLDHYDPYDWRIEGVMRTEEQEMADREEAAMERLWRE